MDASICSKCGEKTTRWSTATLQSLKITTAPGTRVQSLMHSNEPPEPSEIASIQSSASDIDAPLASLDAEISRLQKRLRSLQQDRSELLDLQRMPKSILSPLRRMPTEILAEIFVSSLPTSAELFNRTKFQIKASPWIWTRVCSRWREVAISTPALWSLILMNFANYHYPLEAAAAHVERSRMLKIHFSASNDPDDTSSQTRMLTYLLEHSLRWEELFVALTRDLIPVLPSLRHKIPSLKRFWAEWEREDDEENEEVARVFDFLQTAESLVDIGVSRCILPPSFIPRTNQLTHYYADAPWDLHRAILSLSSSLIEAHINTFPENPEWSTLTGELIELSQLRRLYVSHVDALAYLKTPLLSQITLDLPPGESNFHPALEHFLVTYSRTLRRMGLRGMPDALLASRILQGCPALTELAIMIDSFGRHRRAYEASSVFIQLLIPTEGSVKLSGLKRLHFAFEGTLALDHELYAQMLELRWNLQPRLRLEAATVCFESDPTLGSSQPRLEALRNGGLDLAFSQITNVQGPMAHWLCKPRWIL
ncbi:hypothetical protein FB45DRAFT_1127683 [Roridomyces roridus]|uniref:F-box domain-containing protein n=1 Tax=Roridomyces roridus TaxID=1738132 RepID=A0AAD7B3K3_9AGAR|nr:hypothetical protein FB45DRAFT_1127683 [Roridomyces roridus]